MKKCNLHSIFLMLLTGFIFPIVARTQNHSYTLIYEQVYSQYGADEYYTAKALYQDICRMYTVDPSERSFFSKYALMQGDVDFFKEESKDLMLGHGYFFSAADTLRNNIFIENLRKHNLTAWLVSLSNELYPEWIKNHPEAYLVQQKLSEIKSQGRSAYYFELIKEDALQKGDSSLVDLTLKYQREYEFELFIELLDMCKTYGLPNNFDHGCGVTQNMQQFLPVICNDKFNFERCWHHIFPFMERAYFDGKISSYFLKIYDRSCAVHYGYQYFGTQPDSITVKDEKTLDERRKKYGL